MAQDVRTYNTVAGGRSAIAGRLYGARNGAAARLRDRRSLLGSR